MQRDFDEPKLIQNNSITLQPHHLVNPLFGLFFAHVGLIHNARGKKKKLNNHLLINGWPHQPNFGHFSYLSLTVSLGVSNDFLGSDFLSKFNQIHDLIYMGYFHGL